MHVCGEVSMSGRTSAIDSTVRLIKFVLPFTENLFLLFFVSYAKYIYDIRFVYKTLVWATSNWSARLFLFECRHIVLTQLR